MLGTFKNSNIEPRDKLIIINQNGTADIATIYDQDHERLTASSGTAEYAVPLADVKAYAGSRGIIYTYPAAQENIEDCKRLAELEKSIVLRQITQYEKPLQGDAPKDIKTILMYVVIVILIIIVAVK